MNIQSGINQTLSIASLLMSQTPLAEKARQKQREQEEIKRLGKKVDVASEATDVAFESGIDPKPSEETYQAYETALGKETEARKQLFEANPTPETYKQYLASEENLQEQKEAAETDRIKKAKEEEKRIALSNRVASILEGTGIDPVSATKNIERLRNKK